MHGPKRMRRARRSCSMAEVVSRALGAARWSSRTERAAGPKPGGPGSHHGSRRASTGIGMAGRSRDLARRVASASARGSPSRSARGGSYPGSQSHSAAASRSISPSTVSPRHGRRASCSQRRWRRPSYRGTDRLRFPWRWVPLPLAAGLATATVKRVIIAHPVLAAALWNVDIAGFVEVARGARALGPHRGAGRAHRRAAA